MKKIDFEKYAYVKTYKLEKIIRKLSPVSELRAVLEHIIQKRADRKTMNYSKKAIVHLIFEHQAQDQKIRPAKIGSKDDTYFTESDLLDGFQCSFNDLSTDEKKIFLETQKGEFWNKNKIYKEYKENLNFGLC